LVYVCGMEMKEIKNKLDYSHYDYLIKYHTKTIKIDGIDYLFVATLKNQFADSKHAIFCLKRYSIVQALNEFHDKYGFPNNLNHDVYQYHKKQREIDQ